MSQGVKTPPETLRKIRDMIRAGYSQREAAKATGVSTYVASLQGRLLERFEGINSKAAGSEASMAKRSMGSTRAKQNVSMGHEYDPEAMDLVDIFATPRTPRQLRRFSSGD